MKTNSRSSIILLSEADVLLGFWVVISPFLLPFHHSAPANWNNVVIGWAIALVALVRLSSIHKHPGWSWGAAVLGFWLVISPFVLGFASVPAALWNNLIAGALVLVPACGNAVSAEKGGLRHILGDLHHSRARH
jgi:hypothetical protein